MNFVGEMEVDKMGMGRCIREGPEWLDKLLLCDYFSTCLLHKSARPARNHFCVECNEGPICSAGLDSHHHGHKTLQIRKASHHDAIKVSDIQKFIDISGIQCYSINADKIVFLLRPKAKLHQGRSKRRCFNCKRALNDAGMLMCSIKCKLNAVRESLLRQGKGDNNGGHDGFDSSAISLALKETSVSRGREVVNHNEVISSHGCCDGSPSPFKRRKIENGLSMEEKCHGIQVGNRIHNAEFVSPVSPDSVLKSDSSLNALNVNFDKSTLDSSHHGGEEQRPGQFQSSLAAALGVREFTSSQGDYQYKLQHCCHHQNRLHRRNRRKGIPERAPFF